MQRKFTSPEVAELFNVAHATVNKWIKEGTLKAFKLPSRDNRVLEEDLVEFMNKHSIPLKLLKELKRETVPIKERRKKEKVRTILIVDDDPAVISLLKKFFQTQEGCRIKTADTIIQACDIIKNFKPQLLMMDNCLNE